MKKVLFLTKSFPGFSKSASVLCTKRLIESMATDSNYEVHCLCTKGKNENYEDFCRGVYIHRVKKTLWKNYYDSKDNNPKLQSILLKIQKLLTFLIFPNIDPFMLRTYNKFAIYLQKKFSYDIVIAEHHGYTTLMTGNILKQRFPQIQFYPILWDPILGQTKPNFLPEWFVDKRISSLEDITNKTADNIFSIQAAKSIYSDITDTSYGKRVYFDIPGILPPHIGVETKYMSLLNKGFINITFSGLLGAPLRDPAYIIRLLNSTSFANKINVIFFCKGIKKHEMHSLKDTFKGNIHFHSYIPIEELYTIYHHSDFLLNISNINANMTPSKIFEYMSYGKPIISSYVTDGDAAKKYLDNYPESISIDQKNNFEENVSILETFLRKNHELVTFDLVKSLFPLNSPDYFVKYISKIQIQS